MSEEPARPEGTSSLDYQEVGMRRPAPVRRDHPAHESVEIDIVQETRLSAGQHRTAQGLLRLYQSLCGSEPGRYAPQSLLDTAGGFNRPPFPGRPPGPTEGRNG